MPIRFTFAIAAFNLTSVRSGRVILALYALQLDAQPFTVGMLAATFSVLPMLLSWQAGRLADRFGARWQLTFGTFVGACGMLVPFMTQNITGLFIGAAMNGVCFAFGNVALQNLVGKLSSAGRRAANFSNYSLIISASAFVGSLMSGFAIDHFSHRMACLLPPLLSIAPLAMLLIAGGRLPGGSGAAKRGGIRHALQGPGMWGVLITSSLVTAGIDLYQFYMPIYGHGIGLTASTIGVVLAMFAAASFAVRLIMSQLLARFTEEQVLAAAFYVGAVSLMLIPFCHSVLLLSLLSFSFGLGMGCGNPITMNLTFSNSADGRTGELMGLRVTVNHFTRVLSPVIFGSIASAFGLFPAFWLNGLMLAAGGVVTRRGMIDTGGKRDADGA